MIEIADVMADTPYAEETILDFGISGDIEFLVVVPEVGACRVPNVALSHFMAGADEYAADSMPEYYSEALSGPWRIKRERLRILADSWARHSRDLLAVAKELDANSIRANTAKLPVFKVEARPSQVPPELTTMNAASQIRNIDQVGGAQSEGITSVGDYIETIHATIARQAKGYFTIDEAAQDLADSVRDVDVKDMIAQMLRAFRSDELTIRNPGDKLPLLDGNKVHTFIHLVTIDDVNQWLMRMRVPYRMKTHSEAAQPQAKQDSANEWVSDAQRRAREIIKESKAKDRYPNQESIGDQIAREFRAAGKVGVDGKPLSGATIKRHALNGISSAIGKQLSTTKRQGK